MDVKWKEHVQYGWTDPSTHVGTDFFLRAAISLKPVLLYVAQLQSGMNLQLQMETAHVASTQPWLYIKITYACQRALRSPFKSKRTVLCLVSAAVHVLYKLAWFFCHIHFFVLQPLSSSPPTIPDPTLGPSEYNDLGFFTKCQAQFLPSHQKPVDLILDTTLPRYIYIF